MNSGTESTAQQVSPVAGGKLLVLGSCTSQVASDYCVRRLNADGSNDTSFGIGGQGEAVVNPGGQDFPSMMAVGPDGKIVIGGLGTTGRLARLSVNGLLDTSFGGTGLVGTVGIRALAVRGNGKVVFTGEFGFPMSQFCVGQLDVNGGFDPAFNGGSMLQFTPTFTRAGKSTEAFALTLAPDGSTYLGGRCDVGVGASTLNNFCVAKITPASALDASFGNAGSINTSVLGANDYIETPPALALQADGKLIAAGRCYNS